MVNALKNTDCEDLKSHMLLLQNTWIANQQMGESEAVYKLIKEFHFKESDIRCCVCFPADMQKK